MFELLSSKIENAIKTLKGQGRITEINIASTIKEIRRALISADVQYNVAKNLTNKIKEKALGQNILIAVSPGQLLIKIVNEELSKLMGGIKSDINLSKSFSTILIVGLQGSGKTTFSAKLAYYLKNKNKEVLLTTCDIYRPAAIEQLKVLSENIGVSIYLENNNKNVIQIVKNAINYAKLNNKEIVIIDTAGRLSIDNYMMQEIYNLKSILNPSEILFIVDSMTGQDAVITAKLFNDKIDFDGIVLTKLDGDTRGGAALSIRSIVNKPIKFISRGEKMDSLDIFYPDRMSRRILGMSDVLSFVEKAEKIYSEASSKEINKKLLNNKFNFNDLLTQIGRIKKMGGVKDLYKMIFGSNKISKDNINEDIFQDFEVIIKSMTKKEKLNPEILNGSRRTRIASGSGKSIQQVNNLVTKFHSMCAMIKKGKKNKTLKNKMSIFNKFIGENKN